MSISDRVIDFIGGFSDKIVYGISYLMDVGREYGVGAGERSFSQRKKKRANVSKNNIMAEPYLRRQREKVSKDNLLVNSFLVEEGF